MSEVIKEDNKVVNKVLLVDPLLRTRHAGLYDDFNKKYDIPYGLLAIGSHLASKGIESKIISLDYETEALHCTDETVLNRYLEIVRPRIVGFCAYTIQYEDAKRLAALVKASNPNIVVVIGGHHAMHQPEEVLVSRSFDAVILGEGEKPFEEYVKRIFGKSPIDDIQGIACYCKEKSFVKNNYTKRLSSNEIVTPDYNLLPNGLVYNANIEIMTSRGCPFDCYFCSSFSQYGRKVITRSLNSVKEEIKTLNEKYGHARIGILDETVNAREDFEEFLKMLRELHEELNISYLAQTRADAVVKDQGQLPEIKKSGIVSLIIGAESASNVVLKEMNKMSSYETVLNALELIKKAGIAAGTFWIVGHPGSSYEEEMKTRDAIEYILKNNMSDYIEVNIFVPYPGTRASKDIRIRDIDTDFTKYHRFVDKPVYDLVGFPRNEISRAYNDIIRVLESYGRKNGIGKDPIESVQGR